MSVNKHGIPVAQPKKKRKPKIRELDYKDFAEFVGYENGIEVTIIVPNHKALVQAMLADDWVFQKYSRGEIA